MRLRQFCENARPHPGQVKSLTRLAATLSHPMGEGQGEGEKVFRVRSNWKRSENEVRLSANQFLTQKRKDAETQSMELFSLATLRLGVFALNSTAGSPAVFLTSKNASPMLASCRSRFRDQRSKPRLASESFKR